MNSRPGNSTRTCIRNPRTKGTNARNYREDSDLLLHINFRIKKVNNLKHLSVVCACQQRLSKICMTRLFEKDIQRITKMFDFSSTLSLHQSRLHLWLLSGCVPRGQMTRRMWDVWALETFFLTYCSDWIFQLKYKRQSYRGEGLVSAKALALEGLRIAESNRARYQFTIVCLL